MSSEQQQKNQEEVIKESVRKVIAQLQVAEIKSFSDVITILPRIVQIVRNDAINSTSEDVKVVTIAVLQYLTTNNIQDEADRERINDFTSSSLSKMIDEVLSILPKKMGSRCMKMWGCKSKK